METSCSANGMISFSWMGDGGEVLACRNQNGLLWRVCVCVLMEKITFPDGGTAACFFFNMNLFLLEDWEVGGGVSQVCRAITFS